MSKKIHIGSMSREQAIGILNKLMVAMKTYDGVSPTQERINALQMAIDSLEADEAYQLEYEKPEFCEDCISRKDFLDICKKYCDANCAYLENQRAFMCKACMMGDAIVVAESMPSVLPKAIKNHLGEAEE